MVSSSETGHVKRGTETEVRRRKEETDVCQVARAEVGVRVCLLALVTPLKPA